MTTIAADPAREFTISARVAFLLAIACGLVVANVYYSQPIVGPIAASLGMPATAAGLIVTLTQVGFGAGLLLIVPLGDLIENRRLVQALICLSAIGLLAAGLSTHPLPFLLGALTIGLGSVAVQVMVPYAAHLAPEAIRGRVVGNVMSGLMIGIMLARPASSFVTELTSWHIVFYLGAAIMLTLALVLGWAMPERVPEARLSYAGLLKSMGHLAVTTPILQRRAVYQFCMFGAFSVFWTTVPLLLASPLYNASQGYIALFALVGGAGAIAAPVAGRVADKGWTRPATAGAVALVALSWVVAWLGGQGSAVGVGLLMAAAILLDFGMTASLTLGQRAIFILGAHHRSRLNGLFIAAFFCGGAVGSMAGGWAWATGGWPLTALIGLAFPLVALVFFVATERQPSP
jgi:predicted MFS family arabinose efflux permease